MTLASKHLNTSQPSLSMQLKTLEGNLECPLFQKVGRNIELTHQGQIVYNYCVRAFEVTQELNDYLKNNKKAKGPRIRLGISDEIERPFATDLVAQILKKYPANKKPMIKMISYSHEAILNRFNMGEVDYFLTTQPVYDQDAAVISEVAIPIVLVCKTGLISGISADMSAADVLKKTSLELVLPAPELNLRSQIDKFIQKHKINKNIVFESNIFSSLTRAISDGFGIGFLPFPYVSRDIEHGRLGLIGKKALWNQNFYLVSNKRTIDSIFSNEFKTQLKIYSQKFKV